MKYEVKEYGKSYSGKMQKDIEFMSERDKRKDDDGEMEQGEMEEGELKGASSIVPY